MRVNTSALGRFAVLALYIVACLSSHACQSDQRSTGEQPAAPAATARQASASLERKIAFLEDALSRRSEGARVLGDLTMALSGRVWLTEAVDDGHAVRVTGRAPSNSLVADYVSGLERSAVLADVGLVSSTQWGTRTTGYVEFEIQASVRNSSAENAPGPGRGRNAEPPDALGRRLEELEKVISARTESAGALRELQNAANEARLAVTTFAPGAEAPAEFYTEWPVSIEVAGSRESLKRYLEAIAGLPRLWLVSKLSLRAESDGDPRSPVRASLTVRTYLLRDTGSPHGR